MKRGVKSVNKNAVKQKELLIIFLIILICLIFLVAFFAFDSYKDYSSFRIYKNYLKNNSSIEIQSWMTPYTVLRHFNITQEDLFKTLNTTNSTLNFRKQISSICSEKKENCTLIVEELNSKVK